jgi:hypothetical protein
VLIEMAAKLMEWLLNNIVFENRRGVCVLQKIDVGEITLLYTLQQIHVNANKPSES